MKHLGIVSYKKAVGAKDVKFVHPSRLVPRYKKPEKPIPWKVSAAMDAHLRAWWAGARAARNLGCGGLLPGFDYIGDDRDWPDMVHVGALAQAAGRSLDRAVSKYEMGAWLGGMGLRKVQKVVNRRDHKGRIVYTTTRVFYVVSPFRTVGVDRQPTAW